MIWLVLQLQVNGIINLYHLTVIWFAVLRITYSYRIYLSLINSGFDGSVCYILTLYNFRSLVKSDLDSSTYCRFALYNCVSFVKSDSDTSVNYRLNLYIISLVKSDLDRSANYRLALYNFISFVNTVLAISNRKSILPGKVKE